MYSKTKYVKGLWLCAFSAIAFAAQPGAQNQNPAGKEVAVGTTKSLHENPLPSRLLNPSEGLSVIDAALETRGDDRSSLDCSHLVQIVYERAGFPYPYVSSSQIYAGVHGFRRVTRPQPGDLVVWPGHVGIVTNPSQNSFFGVLNSGIGVESYSSSYWKGRGTPRFYRYAKGAGSEDMTKVTQLRKRTALDLSVNPQVGPSLDFSPVKISSPRAQAIDSERPEPEEIMQAASLAFAADPDDYRRADVFKLARPLIVFGRLEVRSVKIHGNRGRVQVRITVPLSIKSGQANLETGLQTQTWQLRRRDRKSWDLLLPQDTIYLSRNNAVRILAHQLSLLADTEDASADLSQKSQLARLLNTLLAE